MALLSSILAGILLFSAPHVALAQTDNGNECSCFRTNGSSEGYFAYHRFFDYRNVVGAPVTPPAVISNADDATNAYATSEFFLNNTWTNDWTIQNWNNSDSFEATDASILMVNSPNNIYIGPSTHPSSSPFLTIRREKQRQFTRLLLLSHLPNLPPPRLPIRRRSRLK
jgi:hypothetical protein